MKIIFLLVIFLTINVSVLAQKDDDNKNFSPPFLKLSGNVKNIKVDENLSKYWTQIILSIDINLKNNGTVPIILLNKESMFCYYAGIAKTVDELDKKNLTYSQYTLIQSSIGLTENEWELNKLNLDKNSPPSELTLILPPGSSKTFNYDLYLHLPLQLEGFAYKEYTFNQLKDLSPVYLRLLGCNFRKYGVAAERKDRRGFSKKLQKKWKNYGYLLLEEMNSEPVLLDFSAAEASF